MVYAHEADGDFYQLCRDRIAARGDGWEKLLDNLIAIARESDEARRILQDAGYGVTGTPLAEMARHAWLEV